PSRPRRTPRRLALAICAGLSALAMVANATVSDAASSPLAWLMIPVHWLHVSSYAVWIGGLAAVLVGIRGLPTVKKARAVRRFSLVAGVAFAAMILTGLVRGIDEVGSWSNLFTTTFGWVLLAKTALFFTIAPLAAMKRGRYVRVGEIGESILELRGLGNGIYTAEGTRLSLAGSWTVTVVVETASTSYDAVLPIKTAERP